MYFTLEKTYKFRIYPNKEQKILLAKTFGCVRYVYNHFLALRQKKWKAEQITLNFYDCSKLLTILKQEKEWLKDVDGFSLQNSLKDLEFAYKMFWKKNNAYPKFKSKHSNYFSYRTQFCNNNIEFLGNSIKLPKLKKVKIKDKTTKIQGRILNATITQVPSGKYYVSIVCTDVEIQPLKKTNKNVGIDLGIKELATLSDNTKYENKHYLKNSLKRLELLHKRLTRKPKGSQNRNKARIKLAKLYERITNQRQDYLQKVTTEIVRNCDIICIEDLKISNMLKNRKLAQAISDCGWYTFTEMLKYKCNWYGKQLIKVPTFYASSQLCSNCGYKNKDVKDLKVRIWTCPVCNEVHDRDINASKNILQKGLEILNN